MNSAVCAVLLPDCACGMRACRKELFGSYCWLGKLENISVWYPKVLLEESVGHGCRWSEKYLVKFFQFDRK